MKKRFDDSSDARLHALLQVKRLERPDARRWQQFERGLEQKQLAAIVGTKQRSFRNWWHIIFGKKLAYTLTAVSLCVVGASSIRYMMSADNEQYYDKIVDVANNSSRSYVCDVLMPDRSFLSDQGSSLSFNGRGVGYVCDAITTNAATY
ncbi:MAG: hypothetical protein K2L13_00300 [Opitutales bacterium]|nr:hypothetical protein [Opitutales bacterium]